jgi:hypothetical protein
MRDTDHSSPSRVEVENMRSFAFAFPIITHGMMHIYRGNFISPFTEYYFFMHSLIHGLFIDAFRG